MRVRVLYFAAVRELVARAAGQDGQGAEEELQLPPSVRTVADFSRWLPSVHPALEGQLATVRVARNEAFARDEDELREGDVVALIPPVAGG